MKMWYNDGVPLHIFREISATSQNKVKFSKNVNNFPKNVQICIKFCLKSGWIADQYKDGFKCL